MNHSCFPQGFFFFFGFSRGFSHTVDSASVGPGIVDVARQNVDVVGGPK